MPGKDGEVLVTRTLLQVCLVLGGDHEAAWFTTSYLGPLGATHVRLGVLFLQGAHLWLVEKGNQRKPHIFAGPAYELRSAKQARAHNVVLFSRIP